MSRYENHLLVWELGESERERHAYRLASAQQEQGAENCSCMTTNLPAHSPLLEIFQKEMHIN